MYCIHLSVYLSIINIYLSIYHSIASFYPGIRDTIDHIKSYDNNIRLGALSNACGDYVRAVLAVNEVSQCFDCAYGADEVTRGIMTSWLFYIFTMMMIYDDDDLWGWGWWSMMMRMINDDDDDDEVTGDIMTSWLFH